MPPAALTAPAPTIDAAVPKDAETKPPVESEEQHTWGEFLVLGFYVVGVWVSFLVFGWTQEMLAAQDFEGKKFNFTHVSVLLQSVANMLTAFIAIVLETLITKKPFTVGAGVRVQDWIVASLGYQGAHFFGFQSLQYVSFPVQIVCKSCKTIPVMIGEVLIAGERATLKKFVSVILLSIGVILFLFFKPSKKFKHADEFEFTWTFLYGLFLILLALICDGIYGPYQNKIRNKYKLCGAFNLMFNMNMFQGLFSFIWAVGDGELQEAFHFIQTHSRVVPYLVNFCASMAVGSSFIYLLQRKCGALMVSKTTTVRKLMSVLVSASYFGHPISPVQWIGVVVVFTSKFTAPYFVNLIKSLQGSSTKKAKTA
mmetsp:Transcript_14342/g.28930  ORF Transcript_14342/g.28930 Transcript_14342/m.28930 type:complete len:368 (+) Transcript_14342:32-1135(+)